MLLVVVGFRLVCSDDFIVHVGEDDRLIIIVDGVAVVIMRVAVFCKFTVGEVAAHVFAPVEFGVGGVVYELEIVLVVFPCVGKAGVGFCTVVVVGDLLTEEDGLFGDELVWPEVFGEVNAEFEEFVHVLFVARGVGEGLVEWFYRVVIDGENDVGGVGFVEFGGCGECGEVVVVDGCGDYVGIVFPALEAFLVYAHEVAGLVEGEVCFLLAVLSEVNGGDVGVLDAFVVQWHVGWPFCVFVFTVVFILSVFWGCFVLVLHPYFHAIMETVVRVT